MKTPERVLQRHWSYTYFLRFQFLYQISQKVTSKSMIKCFAFTCCQLSLSGNSLSVIGLMKSHNNNSSDISFDVPASKTLLLSAHFLGLVPFGVVTTLLAKKYGLKLGLQISLLTTCLSNLAFPNVVKVR